MAHTKSAGSTRLGRDSISKRLGVKRQDGQAVKSGEILIRQRGTKYAAGVGVRRGNDDTLYAAVSGTVKFRTKLKTNFNGNRRRITEIAVLNPLK